MSEKGVYDVLWPLGKKAASFVPFARRLDSLEGKTIGELWDWLFRGNEIFPAIEKGLARRFPGIKFVSYDTFGPTHGGGEAETIAAIPDRIKVNSCDAVISAIGC